MKKILNKRGSVLFLVVVIMAILVVAASATYYVLSNQHASAETHYSSEQSYQTAYSVSDTIKRYFTEYNKKIASKEATFEGSIFEKMWDSVVPLTAAKDLREFGLGEFDITIEKTGTEVDPSTNSETRTFDITVLADTNGETTKLTQVWTITLSEEETEYYTRFLTSTGEDTKGRDVRIGAQNIYGETYFENNYTSLSNAWLHRSLYCLGTLVDIETGIVFKNAMDKEMVIAGNYYNDTAGGKELAVNRVLVGNDFFNNNKPINSNVVYVCGDLFWNANQSSTDATFFVQEDCHLNSQIGTDSVIYVGGDLYIGDDLKDSWDNCGTFYVDGNVYIKGGNGNVKNVFYTGTFTDEVGIASDRKSRFIGAGEPGFVSFDIETELNKKAIETQDAYPDTNDVFADWMDVVRYISNNTAKGSYQDWNAEAYFNAHYGPDSANPAPTVDFETSFNLGKGQEISEGLPLYGSDGSGPIEIPNSEFAVSDGGWGPYVATIGTHCRLRSGSISANQSLVVFDTSSVSDDALYVYLDCPAGEDVFNFFGQWTAGTDIIVKGSKPVIFVLPEDKSIEIGEAFIGHYDLASYFKGTGDLEAMRGYINQAAANKKGDSGILFKEDESTGLTVFNPSAFGGSDVHNNIFLVGNGYGTVKVNGQFTFCGYIYTPHMMMDFTDNTGSLSFIGGLIVGTYIYNSTSSDLVFINPNPLDIVTDLMSQANNTPGVPKPDDQNNRVTVDFIAYR